MTPEREAAIRKIAARDGESWRSSKVSNLALRETVEAMTELLAELDALRAKVAAFRDYTTRGERLARQLTRNPDEAVAWRNTVATAVYEGVIDHAREIGLFTEDDDG